MRVAPALLTIATLAVLASALPCAADTTLFFSGNLRNDATVLDCPTGCTLDSSSSDSDYATYAAVVDSFTVASTSTMSAITYSYGGGTSLTGPSVAAGGLEPYLSLFDASGNFLRFDLLRNNVSGGSEYVRRQLLRRVAGRRDTRRRDVLHCADRVSEYIAGRKLRLRAISPTALRGWAASSRTKTTQLCLRCHSDARFHLRLHLLQPYPNPIMSSLRESPWLHRSY